MGAEKGLGRVACGEGRPGAELGRRDECLAEESVSTVLWLGALTEEL